MDIRRPNILNKPNSLNYIQGQYDLNGQLLKKTEFGDDGSELVTEYRRDAAAA